MAKFTASKTPTWEISIKNNNWYSVTHWNKLWLNVADINRMLKNYMWNDPVWYIKKTESERLDNLLP